MFSVAHSTLDSHPLRFRSSGTPPVILRIVPCEEKTKLIEAYKVLVANYSTAVNDLNLTMGKISKPEYELLLANSNAKRELSEKARHELNRHTREHGC